MKDSPQNTLTPEGNFPQTTFHFVAALEQSEGLYSGLKPYGQRVSGNTKAMLVP